jgi:hypothetical protein
MDFAPLTGMMLNLIRALTLYKIANGEIYFNGKKTIFFSLFSAALLRIISSLNMQTVIG